LIAPRLLGRSAQILIPGEFYRSMILEPVIKVMTPD
jgi:hypothetical protein